jgi:hypothetical protein
MYGVDEIASRVSSFVGLALALAAVAHIVKVMALAARRSAREWGLVARHVRRASAARASARLARERLARERESPGPYADLRRHARRNER